MEVEFLTADTALPPCLPLPGPCWGCLSSTAKVMYARLLGEIYTAGTEDINGILFGPISHCGTGRRAAGAQCTDLQANLAGIGGRRIDPAGAPGDRSAEPDLCPHSKKLNR